MNIQNYSSGMIGTNCYLVWDEASKEGMIVDPGGYVSQIENVVETEGLTVKYIVLTHGHGDHIGGVTEFHEKYPDALLVAGENEAELLGNPRMNMSGDFGGRPESFEADIWVKEKDEITLGDLHFVIFETPGHTPGGITLYVADGSAIKDEGISGVAITGDTLFRESIGRTDFPGGDFNVLADSIRTKLYTLPLDTVVLPGHMGFTTIEYEVINNPFVRS